MSSLYNKDGHRKHILYSPSINLDRQWHEFLFISFSFHVTIFQLNVYWYKGLIKRKIIPWDASLKINRPMAIPLILLLLNILYLNYRTASSLFEKNSSFCDKYTKIWILH